MSVTTQRWPTAVCCFFCGPALRAVWCGLPWGMVCLKCVLRRMQTDFVGPKCKQLANSNKVCEWLTDWLDWLPKSKMFWKLHSDNVLTCVYLFMVKFVCVCVCAVVFGRCLQILHVMGTEFGAAFVVRCPFGSCWLNLSSALLCSVRQQRRIFIAIVVLL